MENLKQKAEELLTICKTKKILVATAESCTGGMVSSAITDIPGSSEIFDRGFITYSNEAKMEMLGVQAEIIDKYGAVSKETAIAMAEGAIKKSRADISVSITGIAGPGGGSDEKPVGLIYFGFSGRKMAAKHEKHIFDGNRQQVRQKATLQAIEILIKLANSSL